MSAEEEDGVLVRRGFHGAVRDVINLKGNPKREGGERERLEHVLCEAPGSPGWRRRRDSGTHGGEARGGPPPGVFFPRAAPAPVPVGQFGVVRGGGGRLSGLSPRAREKSSGGASPKRSRLKAGERPLEAGNASALLAGPNPFGVR